MRFDMCASAEILGSLKDIELFNEDPESNRISDT